MNREQLVNNFLPKKACAIPLFSIRPFPPQDIGESNFNREFVFLVES